MKIQFSVKGVNEVIHNLRKTEKNHGVGVERGLKKGGLLIQRESQLEVPRDLGVLANSAFTRAQGKGFDCSVIVGYTAGYAIYVHENLDAAHGTEFNEKYAAEIAAGIEDNRGPRQKAKFLEDPANANAGRVVKFIIDEVEKEKLRGIPQK